MTLSIEKAIECGASRERETTNPVTLICVAGPTVTGETSRIPLECLENQSASVIGIMVFTVDKNRSATEILREIDPLMIAVGLAIASLAPGPAGEAGAVAAIAFDLKRRRWPGAFLSGVSMIPLFGYVPAAFKVALLVHLLDRRLKNLEAVLAGQQNSSDTASEVQQVLGKYQRSVPHWKITRGIRERLERIIVAGHRVTGEGSEVTAPSKR